MIVITVTEDNKIRIKNSSGEIIIDPLSINGLFGAVKEIMQVSEFEHERETPESGE